MKHPIVILSSSKDFTKKFNDILIERHLNYPIMECTGSTTVEMAKKYSQEGTQIFITRGKNLELVRQSTATPVIDVRYTYEDLYYSLEEAKLYSNKIAFIGFDLAYEVARKFQALSNENFLLIKPNDVSDIDQIVAEHSQSGIEVFIGGLTVAKAAQNHGVKNVMIQVDDYSLALALDEALSLLNYEMALRKNFETIQQILNATTEGIISINQSAKLHYINNQARKFLTDDKKNLLIDRILDLPVIAETINLGTTNYNQFIEIGNQSLILNSRPLKIDQQIFGAVVTLQKSDYVQNTEKELRKKLNSKGLVARNNFSDIVGNSPIFLSTIHRAKRFAESDSTVLITGPSGAGKEIFAQSIHNHSSRRNESFVAINCAALPMSILESELFGYVRGAFTGANPNGKTGIFELAHNGTVFLDEIGEMSPETQAKLLRVIQEKEITRIGDDKVIPVNVRIIGATNKNLLEEIEKNTFREDLYYRLCVLELKLPSLDERREDIPLLIRHFIQRQSPQIQISDEALHTLSNLAYRGNIRHLQNIIERLIVMRETNIIDNSLVYKVLDLHDTQSTTLKLKIESLVEDDEPSELKKMEYQLIQELMAKYEGNRTKVAKELGISYTTLWRRLKKHD
ncbi:MAG: sigma 54-interacting transcriptional regulator [Clostridia bacterium]|nr:sigma 54-interacting transcriptional regulator [Clostridia bacterium]